MFSSWDQRQPDRVVKRKCRTKDACKTCKRRKVRCDEQRPKCSHCRRLELNCEWKDGSLRDDGEDDQTEVQLEPTAEQSIAGQDVNDYSGQWPPNGELPSQNAPNMTDLDLNQLFDYASFMWTGTEMFDQHPGETAPMSASYQSNGKALQFGSEEQLTHLSDAMSWPSPSAPLSETELLDIFCRSNAPPMLMHIEARPKWSAMRKLLLSMASSSAMVRSAVLAFTSLQVQETSQRRSNHSEDYDKAKGSLLDRLSKLRDGSEASGRELALLLAVFFLLIYIDLVSNRSSYAQELLKRAHTLVKSCDSESLGPLERRLISWLRLLDGRAVSAGGEGLFLAEADGDLSALEISSPQHDDQDQGDPDDVQEALLEALSSPGFAFFHKVQSFMGRISLIDPWHRSRGTVEDETQVMNIAAKINKDLLKLYRQRPPLMDLAVEGKLREPYLQPALAASVTRSLRTYLANYHASFIHLHRVAYKHLPRTQSVVAAMTTIQQIARTMSEPCGNTIEPLPVNMLWPLLMWGCEEETLEMRYYISSTIRQMGNVATNASITADVLEEVQRRQDANGQRMDVRSIMQEVFNSNFAVV